VPDSADQVRFGNEALHGGLGALRVLQVMACGGVLCIACALPALQASQLAHRCSSAQMVLSTMQSQT
jgi:hypothetical protein